MAQNPGLDACLQRSVCESAVAIARLLARRSCVPVAEMAHVTGRSRSVVFEAIEYLRDRGIWIEYDGQDRCHYVPSRSTVDVGSITMNELRERGLLPAEDYDILALAVKSSPVSSKRRNPRRLRYAEDSRMRRRANRLANP